MAAEDATTKLTFDATGAQKGLADYKQAGEAAIAIDQAIGQSATKTATTVEAAETRKSTARRTASQSAKDTAAIEAAASAASGDAALVASNRIVTSYSSQQKALDNYAKSLDPFQSKVNQAAKTVANLSDIAAQGGPASARAVELLVPAQKKLSDATDALAKSQRGGVETSGQMSFAVRQLGVQSVQAFSGIATGQSVMQVLIQQGHQVGDVMLSTGTGMGVFRVAASAAFGALTSGPGIAIAAAAGITAIAVAAESTQSRLGALRNELSLVRDNFAADATAADAAAKHLASTSFLSTTQARAGVNAVFGQGSLFQGTSAQAEQIALTAARVAQAVGDVSKAASIAGQVIANPSGVLADVLKAHPEALAFNQQLVDQVRHLQELGQQGQAFNLTIDALTRTVSKQKDATDPLRDAWQKLEQALTGAGQKGDSLASTLGGPVLTQLTSAIKGVTDLTLAIEKMVNALPPWIGTGLSNLNNLAGYLNPVSGPIKIAQDFSNAAGGSGTPASVAAAAATGSGQIVSSSAAGLTYQINSLYKSTFDGFINDLANSGYKINSLGGYNNRNIAGTGTPSYHAQGAAIDINPSDNPVNGANNLPPNIAAIAAKWGLGWGGNWTGGKTDPMHFSVAQSEGGSVPLQHVALSAGGGSTMAGAVGTSDNLTTTNAMSIAGATPEAARLKALEDISKANAALQLPNLDDTKIKQYSQALDEANKRLYEAVTPADALRRTIDNQTTAEGRMITAWGQGSAAALDMTARIKAETEARTIYGGVGNQNAALVETLTQKYRAEAVAQNEVALAQQMASNTQQLEYLQAETNALGINDQARTLMLANLKAEQELKTKGIAVESAFGQQYLGSVQAITQASYVFNQQKAGLDALSGAFTQSFDTIGNAMAQAFIQGQGAAVNWQNVMSTVIQQVMQKLLQLSVLNPIMNSLLGQNNPTIDSVASGLQTAASNGGGGLIGAALRGLGLAGGGAEGVTDASMAVQNSLNMGLSGSVEGVTAASMAVQNSLNAGLMGIVAHAGGVAGTDLPSRYIHAAYFDNAPRFHAGLGNDEVAAILQRGERVLTIAQTQNFDRMVKALPRFHDGMNNDGIGDMIDNFASTFAGGSSKSGGDKDGTHRDGDMNFHFNFGSAPANVDTFHRSATQIARKIGMSVRQEMARGRN